jgi:uncharacterized Zn-finger protein
MNRREVLTGIAAVASAATVANAQVGEQTVLTGGTNLTAQWTYTPPKRDPIEDAKQYEICKQRGHVQTLGNEAWAVNAVVTPEMIEAHTPHPEKRYVEHQETEWSTCFYCGTRWRYVTNLEEVKP